MNFVKKCYRSVFLLAFLLCAFLSSAQVWKPLPIRSAACRQHLAAAEAAYEALDIRSANRHLQAIDSTERGWEWQLLHDRMHRAVWRMQLPAGVSATSLAYSPANWHEHDFWAAGCTDKLLRIRSLEDPAYVLDIPLGDCIPRAIAFDEQQRSILVAGSKGILRAYALNNGLLIHDYSQHFKADITQFVFNPNLHFAAAATYVKRSKSVKSPGVGIVQVIDLKADTLVQTFQLPDRHVTALALYTREPRLLIGTDSMEVSCHAWQTGDQIWRNRIQSPLRGAAISGLAVPFADYLGLVACTDGHMRALDLPDGKILYEAQRSEDHRLPVRVLSTLNESDPLAGWCFTGGDDGIVKRWWSAGLSSMHQWLEHEAPITALCIVPPYKTISASSDGLVALFDMQHEREELTLPVAVSGFHAFDIRQDGAMAGILALDHSIVVHSLADWSAPAQYFQNAGTCLSLAVDGYYVATGGADTLLHIYDRLEQAIRSQAGQGDTIRAIDFAHAGYALVSVSRNKAVFWELEDGSPSRSYPLPCRNPVQVQYALDDRTIYVANDDGTVYLVNSANGTVLDSLVGRLAVTEMAMHPTLPLLAIGGPNGTYQIWNTRTKTRLSILQGPPQISHGFAFHPRLPLAVSCGEDRMVHVWDPIAGYAIVDLHFSVELTDIALVNGGNRLVIGSWGSRLHIIDLN